MKLLDLVNVLPGYVDVVIVSSLTHTVEMWTASYLRDTEEATYLNVISCQPLSDHQFLVVTG